MSAYCLFDILEVTDVAKFEEYKAGVSATIEQYGGRYVVGAGKVDLVEGTWKPTNLVIIQFPSLEEAHQWYQSEEYADLLALRLSAGRFNAIFMEGL